MTRDTLTARIGEVADGVLADWRWVRDDLSVSVLGMVLSGFGLESGRANGLTGADIDAAVLRVMTERIGAAAKWSGGLVAEANAAARNKDHHRGHYELIEVGRTYHGATNQRALIENVYANFASVRERAGMREPTILVFLNPLVTLLAARERQKGSPLTESEVLAVRDSAACMAMPLAQAERFDAALDSQMPIPRLHPERLWEQWQAVRERNG